LLQRINNATLINSVKWKSIETTAIKIVQTTVSIAIARLVGPEEYSIVPLTLVFINLLSILVNNSFGVALIQNKDAKSEDFRSAVSFNLVLAFLLFFLLWISSDYIAAFYDSDEFSDVLRVLGMIIPMHGILSICNAYIAKNFLFKEQCVCNLVAISVAGTLGIVLAIRGVGAWSLVIYQLAYYLLYAIGLELAFKWKIYFKFSVNSIKRMLKFGLASVGSCVIAFFSDEIGTILLGKYETHANLSLYSKGKQFPTISADIVNTVIAGVSLPALSLLQDDAEKMREQVSVSTRAYSYISGPFLVGVAICAEPMVYLLLGTKWLGAIPIVQIMCLYYVFQPVLQVSGQVLLAIGKPTLKMMIEIAKMIISLSLLTLCLKYGIIAVALSRVAVNIIMYALVLAVNKITIKLSIRRQLMDFVISLIPAILMGVCIYLISFIKLPTAIQFIIQVFFGVVVFVMISKVVKNQTYVLLEKGAKKLIRERRHKDSKS